MWQNIYTKRNRGAAAQLTEIISRKARGRVLFAFQELCRQGRCDIDSMLAGVNNVCLQAYGGIHVDRTEAWASDKLILGHALSCPNDHFLDFVEMCFQSRWYGGGQDGVDMVNAVLQDENIAFEFSPFTVSSTSEEPRAEPEVGALSPNELEQIRRARAPVSIVRVHTEITYPQAVKKTAEPMHRDVVMPALTVLGHPRFKTANDELLAAHRLNRAGDYPFAVGAACSALESTLKIIIGRKGWKYDKDRATLAPLLEVCAKNGLLLPFYEKPLGGAGSIANKIGRHGAGERPEYVADKDQAEHMIYLVSAHIIYLMKLAKL